MKKPELIPAILVKTKNRLKKEIEQVEEVVDSVQIDIMDGRFVDNITVMADAFEGIAKKVIYEVQLMVEDPERYIIPFKQIRADLIIFHIETAKDEKEILELIRKIKDHGMKAGIGLNPETKAEKIRSYLSRIDTALVMTVPPGAGGRRFMPSMLEKVKKLRGWDKKINIEVDGGINQNNICKCVKAGANKIVAGTSIFGKEDIPLAVRQMDPSRCRK